MLPYMPAIIMFVLFFLRIPVAFAMLIATCFYFAVINTTFPVELVVQRLVASTESFPYLAIPFFACAGVVFNYAGITERLMKLGVDEPFAPGIRLTEREDDGSASFDHIWQRLQTQDWPIWE